jgi:DNA-binding IclR family transcriptional regulator
MLSLSLTSRTIDAQDLSQADGDSAVSGGLDEATDNPSARILRTIECLASEGPMTLDQLSERLGVSKSAVWRVVGHLRDAEWVRLKQGNRLIELHHRIDEMFSCATFSDEEFVGIRDKLDDLAAELAVHVDLFALTHNDSVDLIDTTRRWRGDRAALSELLDDDVLMVMRSAMSDAVLARHLAAWEADGTPHRAQRARHAERTLPSLQWSKDTQTLNIAVRGLKGTPGALRISGRRRKLQRQELRNTVSRLRALLHDSIEFIEGPAESR